MSGVAEQRHVGQTEQISGLLDGLNQPSRHSGGWYMGNMLGFDFKAVGSRTFAGNAKQHSFHFSENFFADMATFHQQARRARNDVKRARLDLNIADIENAIA